MSMLWALSFSFVAGCFPADPPGTITLPIEPGRQVTVEWVARSGIQSLWLDLDLRKSRGLVGSIQVRSLDEVLVEGSFNSSRKRIEGQPHSLVFNWVSTPWGMSGQVWLWDLPEVAPGTPMAALVHLSPKEGVVVERLALQVRAR